MASIRKEILIKARSEDVWGAIRDLERCTGASCRGS